MKPVNLMLAKHRVDAVEVLERWVTLIEDNKISEIERLMESGDLDVNGQIINGLTPLHIACIQGNKDVVHALLKHGAEVNAKSKMGRTPILEAAFYAHRDCVDELVKYGADPHPLDVKILRGMAII